MLTESLEIDKEDLRQLAEDASNARLYSSPPDGIVMRAIELGIGTRAGLRTATGFGYDVIEKCLERNSAELSFQTTGEIERFKLKGQVKAASAHGRMTAMILSVLPLFMLIALPFVAPGYLGSMAADSDGKWMIAGAVVAQFLGYYVMRRIVDIKV